MNYADLFDEELICINKEFSSREELFEELSNILYSKGYIEKTFKYAIKKRESEYPTGLATDVMNLAIPHTDVEHVKKPFIFVAKLKKTLPFIQMGTNEDVINVDNIFILGIKDPSKQVNLLSKIMEKLQDGIFKGNYTSISDEKEMATYLKQTFGSEK
ncbi:PTS sugar transporter subunit IIA [Ornithinibacillus sp. L9]|uniref:PTS sugar transporter subunit IIA n=1 Tax=Ornithinibacillus caprae TaxID=2678566 RepID=A0A6N8FGS1_9BACI|nr:PTS sugar transporter subunit IIA [Ornithinibacillus caprae]MUK87464.1 PTS sugar transporter subunit IIA [Ornithinibacillus caprae]